MASAIGRGILYVIVFIIVTAMGRGAEKGVYDAISRKSLTPGQSFSDNGVKEQEKKCAEFGVYFTMTIYNYWKKDLSYHDKEEAGGFAPVPGFTTIRPGTMEKLFGRKTDHGGATGVRGSVSFNIEGTGKMVVVMYSLPWDKGLYSNWLAVGIFPAQSSTDGFYNKMYHYTEKNFKRKEFFGDLSPVEYLGDPDFAVSAETGKTSKEQINVKFYPKKVQMLDTSRHSEL